MTLPTTKTLTTTKKYHSASVVSQLAAQAQVKLQQAFEGTSLDDNRSQYPTFEASELQVGKLLGQGGFSSVYEVRAFCIAGASRTSVKHDDELGEPEFRGGNSNSMEAHRLFLAQHCVRDNATKDARYCLKQLSAPIVANKDTFLLGMTDLALETRILSDIFHPNIIKLRAMAAGPASNLFEGYFIIMDRLYDTLEQRCKKWHKTLKLQKSVLGVVLDFKKTKQAQQFDERLTYAYDLASALAYLHSRHIIYRDLKPENIGFDVRNDIKLFDFGLSRELKDHLQVQPGKDEYTALYRLTAETGSARYMAPEVALGKPYNAKCDTYSFSVLLWEMLALKTPYECYTLKLLKERVFSSMEKRPVVPPHWPASLQTLLQKGWTSSIVDRYSMMQVETVLRKELEARYDTNDDCLRHDRRRSTFVFKNSSVTSTTRESKTQLNALNNNTAAAALTTLQLKMKECDDLCMSDSEDEPDDDNNHHDQPSVAQKTTNGTLKAWVKDVASDNPATTAESSVSVEC